jgi:hypothetical protein
MSSIQARSVLAACFVLGLAGCRVLRPSDLDPDAPWILAVKSCRCPEGEPTITHFAHHTWFDAKLGDDEHWLRIEVEDDTSGVTENAITRASAHADRRFGDREVRVLESFSGTGTEIMIERVRAASRDLSPYYAESYAAWPGPNSNTFATDVARVVPGLSFPLHHNAVGKDHATWIDAGLTTTKTGVRVDTLPIGFALGAREGVELHLLQLTFGVSLWPPRLELPFLPELPWSASVGAPLVERPAAQREVVLLQPGSAEHIRLGGVPAVGTLRIDALDSDHWVHLAWTRTGVVENDVDAPERIRGFLVVVRSFDGSAHESTTLAPAEEGGAKLWTGTIEGRRVTVSLEPHGAGSSTLVVDAGGE